MLESVQVSPRRTEVPRGTIFLGSLHIDRISQDTRHTMSHGPDLPVPSSDTDVPAHYIDHAHTMSFGRTNLCLTSNTELKVAVVVV